MKNLYLEMLHPGLTGSCLGLLLPCWTGTVCCAWDFPPLFLTGLSLLHFSRGAHLAPSLCHLAQDHCGFLGDFRGWRHKRPALLLSTGRHHAAFLAA